jgi:hypothetical protein
MTFSDVSLFLFQNGQPTRSFAASSDQAVVVSIARFNNFLYHLFVRFTILYFITFPT